MFEHHHTTAPGSPWELAATPRPVAWDERINAALAAQDRRALYRVAREAATHAMFYPGATAREALRAHARAMAALRFIPPRRPGRLRRLLAGWRRHG